MIQRGANALRGSRGTNALLLWGLAFILVACTDSVADYADAREAQASLEGIEGVECELEPAAEAFSFEGPEGERIEETPTGGPAPRDLRGRVAFCFSVKIAGGGVQPFWVGFYRSSEAASRDVTRLCGHGVMFYEDGREWNLVLATVEPYLPAPTSLISQIEDTTGIEANSACR